MRRLVRGELVQQFADQPVGEIGVIDRVRAVGKAASVIVERQHAVTGAAQWREIIVPDEGWRRKAVDQHHQWRTGLAFEAIMDGAVAKLDESMGEAFFDEESARGYVEHRTCLARRPIAHQQYQQKRDRDDGRGLQDRH